MYEPKYALLSLIQLLFGAIELTLLASGLAGLFYFINLIFIIIFFYIFVAKKDKVIKQTVARLFFSNVCILYFWNIMIWSLHIYLGKSDFKRPIYKTIICQHLSALSQWVNILLKLCNNVRIIQKQKILK